MTSKTDPKDGTTTYTYTPSGMLHTETDALGGVTVYTYNANDMVASRGPHHLLFV